MPSSTADARAKARAKQVDSRDLTLGNGAVQLLLDEVRLAVLDTLEPVRDVYPITDVLAPLVDEMQLR